MEKIGVEDFDRTLLVVNPARRLLDKAVKDLHRRIRKLQVEPEAAKPDLDGESIQWRAERQEDIQRCMKEKADLCLQRKSTPRKVTIGSLPEADRPAQLLPMTKPSPHCWPTSQKPPSNTPKPEPEWSIN